MKKNRRQLVSKPTLTSDEAENARQILLASADLADRINFQLAFVGRYDKVSTAKVLRGQAIKFTASPGRRTVEFSDGTKATMFVPFETKARR